MRPCRGARERKAIAVSISSGAACFSNAASRSIFASRPLVWATRREVWTRSSRRTGERCTPPLRTASAGRECPPRGDSALGSGCGFSRDQLLTQLPQPPPRRGIVRLRLGAPPLRAGRRERTLLRPVGGGARRAAGVRSRGAAAVVAAE